MSQLSIPRVDAQGGGKTGKRIAVLIACIVCGESQNQRRCVLQRQEKCVSSGAGPTAPY